MLRLRRDLFTTTRRGPGLPCTKDTSEVDGCGRSWKCSTASNLQVLDSVGNVDHKVTLYRLFSGAVERSAQGKGADRSKHGPGMHILVYGISLPGSNGSILVSTSHFLERTGPKRIGCISLPSARCVRTTFKHPRCTKSP